MKSSETITLFGEAPPSPWRPSGFLTSMVLHGAAITLLYAGIKHAPKVVDPFSQRYTVRILNFHRSAPRVEMVAFKGRTRIDAQNVRGTVAPGGGHPQPLSGSRHLAQLIHGPQTLVQPDLPPNVVLPQELPIPLAILWSTRNTQAVTITPPPSQEITNADVRPSLDSPNQEVQLADLRMSATPFMTEMPLPSPSTSSPLTVRRPDAASQVPQTGSQPGAQPTPARVMSLSDLLLQHGSVPLPMVSETALSSSDSFAVERPEGQPQNGNGNPTNNQSGTGIREHAGSQGNEVVAGGTSELNGANTNLANSGSNLSGDDPVTRIQLPRDGHFGVVVVGSSPTEEYPETLGLWTDRLAYTVFLHVGLSKSWILQYSLPRTVDASAAGSATRPDAPWPYVIVRPHLATGDINGNAIMVRGLINTLGHFEKLTVIFPQQLDQAQFVLNALQQWQFRPATQNGRTTGVEVLLIIPNEGA